LDFLKKYFKLEIYYYYLTFGTMGFIV